MKKLVSIPKDAELPLIGLIQIGCIDRGTNVLQVRATTFCPLNCIFCSTDAGENSKTRVTEYAIDFGYLTEGVREIAKFKDNYKLEMHIDSVGDPTTYPELIDLVQTLSDIKGVEVISMQTNGVLLTESKIDELAEAGLSSINLSLDALDSDIAKRLSGCQCYDITRMKEIAKYIVESPIQLLISPVWVPGLNDEEIPRIIEFTENINKNKKWPCLGIQKYEVHKYGRKVKNVKPLSWWKFYKQLSEWEKEFEVKLKIGPKDFGIHKRKGLPYVFKRNEKIFTELKAPGWMANEMISVAKGRCVTIVDCNAEIGDRIKVKILRNKDNIYVARSYN